MSKLIPQTLLNNIPDLYGTEGSLNPTCYVKIFTPDSNWTWYIIEISKTDSTCYGYVKGVDSELGYFDLLEIELLRGPLGLAVELDSSFVPIPFATVKKNEDDSSS